MDVYSLGCVFYEMLSGSPPFHQGDILHQQLTKIPGPIPDVSNEVNQAVLGCLVKDPRRRLKTVEEVEAALAGNRTVKIDRPGTSAAQSKLVPVLLGAAALLAVVGLVVWSRMDGGGDRLKGGSERAIEIPAPAAPPVQTEAAPPVRNITPEFSGKRAAPPQTAEAPRPRRPDISAQLEAARQAHAEGEYQRAINIYREALRLAPESTEAQRGLAAAIRARDAESITSPASLVAGHVAEGNRFHASGDYVRAMEAFQQALAADPQNAQARAGYEKSRKAQAALEAAGIKE
jgi:hypothetical protein